MVAHYYNNSMTIQTDSPKPEMTYVKSRSLVALVTGTMTTTTTVTLSPQLLFTPPVLLLCFSLHETEEDGTERLHPAARRKLLPLQAVSSRLTRLSSLLLSSWEKKKRGVGMFGFSEGRENQNLV